MIIGLARLDDRLIHGQVALIWTKEAKVNRIIVVSDEVAKDKLRSTLLKQAAPPGITASIVDIAKAVRVFNNPKYKKDRVMLLFTTPLDVERVIEGGIPLEVLNIGGVSYKEGKKKLTKAIFLNKEEANSLKRLADSGVVLDVRVLVNDTQENMIALINKNF